MDFNILRLETKNQRTFMSSKGKYKELFEKIRELIDKGHTVTFIRNYVRVSNPNITDRVYNRIYESVIRPIQQELITNRDLMQIQHFARYDRDRDTMLKEIEIAEQSNIFQLDPPSIFKAAEMYGGLLDMIRQKEKLFGLHKKIFKVKLRKYVGEQLNGFGEMKINALTSEEQVDLLRLLKKAKSDEYIPIQFAANIPQEADYVYEEKDEFTPIPILVEEIEEKRVYTHRSLQEELRHKSTIQVGENQK